MLNMAISFTTFEVDYPFPNIGVASGVPPRVIGKLENYSTVCRVGL